MSLSVCVWIMEIGEALTHTHIDYVCDTFLVGVCVCVFESLYMRWIEPVWVCVELIWIWPVDRAKFSFVSVITIIWSLLHEYFFISVVGCSFKMICIKRQHTIESSCVVVLVLVDLVLWGRWWSKFVVNIYIYTFIGFHYDINLKSDAISPN